MLQFTTAKGARPGNLGGAVGARIRTAVRHTTRDPATPYEWAVRLHEQLADSALITHEGDGHTAYMRQNDCVDKAVDQYWLTGKTPEGDALTCKE